jgi:hypothetical protein
VSEVKRFTRSVSPRHKTHAIIIEDESSGTQLIQDLQNAGLHQAEA